MSEAIEWLDDGSAGGTPFSPRFGDRYRSELGGLEQARDVFFKGCGLPQAWAGQARWTILETGFGLGLNFLVTWQAWQADPARPKMLHFVSTEAFPANAADVLRSAASHPELLPLADALAAQFDGLLPGIHRLAFNGGNVLLTLCIGDTTSVLRDMVFEANSVYLDGFSPSLNPDIWNVHTFKAVARCCRRGTRVATWTVARSVRDALAEAGFVVKKVAGIPPKRDNLQGEFNPAWQPKHQRPNSTPRLAGRCIVVGAGLSGAASAASLARRGWSVTVLDAASQPAAGASGLPAGVMAPHVSPDDSVLSRLSRAGLRATLQQCRNWLVEDEDWSPTGVLEHQVDKPRRLPAAWSTDEALTSAADNWSRLASPAQLAAAQLPENTAALWHAKGAWITPAALVHAWLQTPGITWQGQAQVTRLQRDGDGWSVLDADGAVLAAGDLLVLAAAHGSSALLADLGEAVIAPLLQPVRGQVTWAHHVAGDTQALDMPDFPVNGHGSLIGRLPLPDGRCGWVTGGTYERGQTEALIRDENNAQNLEKLGELLPALSRQLVGGDQVFHAWSGVRCATSNRLPAVGPLNAEGDLWLCSGMGSRGLTFAALCGELLAARLHGEPLPVAQKIAEAMQPTQANARK